MFVVDVKLPKEAVTILKGRNGLTSMWSPKTDSMFYAELTVK